MEDENRDLRQVFIVSDGTGITAQNLGHSLMSQFEDIEFNTTTIPYIDSIEKAISTIEKINESFYLTGQSPLVFATLLNPEIREIIYNSEGHIYDLFQAFLAPLEQDLEKRCSYTVGRSHGLTNVESYQKRIDAVHYALDHDDGIKLKGYQKADLIIVGVSRCGKTPTSIYLAMQFGIKVANYPLTDDDLSFNQLPHSLKQFKNKLFGLTISCERLHNIRQDRRPDSPYASLSQCKLEVSEVEKMFDRNNIPYINSTFHSVEEIATRMLAGLGIERKVL